MRRLDDWITGWLKFQDNTEPPECFKEWVAISVIAAALQRKCVLDLGHEVFYPNLYIVLIGPPGSRKGTAMKPGRNILMEKGIRLSADATTKEALIRALRQASGSTPNLETGEVVGHASLTIYSEEMTVFLGYGNLDLMGYLNDWWDCKDIWEYDTKNVELRDHVNAVWVNGLWATTPSILHLALPNEAVGAGLTSRIIFVYAEKAGKVVPFTFLTEEARNAREYLFADLEHIYRINGEFTYTKEFIDKYTDWRFYQEANPPFDDPQLRGYLAKRPAQILKLCMVFSASRSNDMIITGEIFDRSLSTIEKVEVNMPYIFSGYGESRDARVLSQVMQTVALAGEKGVLFSALMDRFHRDADKDMMWRILRTLESMKYCRRDITDPTNPTIIYIEEESKDEG